MNDSDPSSQQAYFYNDEIEDVYVSSMVYHDQQQQQQQPDTLVEPNHSSPVPSYVALQNVALPRGCLIASFFIPSPKIYNSNLLLFISLFLIFQLFIYSFDTRLSYV
jgi:hypothetical protein